MGHRQAPVEDQESCEPCSIVQTRDVNDLDPRDNSGDGENHGLVRYVLDIEWIGLADGFI